MRPNRCCNNPDNIVRAWHKDNIVRKLLRLFRPEPMPHKLVDHCRVCGCNHYVLIVPEIEYISALNAIGA